MDEKNTNTPRTLRCAITNAPYRAGNGFAHADPLDGTTTIYIPNGLTERERLSLADLGLEYDIAYRQEDNGKRTAVGLRRVYDEELDSYESDLLERLRRVEAQNAAILEQLEALVRGEMEEV